MQAGERNGLTMRAAFAALALLATGCATRPQPVPPPAPLISLAEGFDRAATDSAGLDPAVRVARMRAALEPQLPDFYRTGRSGEAGYVRRFSTALEGYPALRDRFLATAREMERRYAGAGARFRRFFPDFQPTTPVYVLHSLGTMDGGVRTVNGRTTLIFGADMIASIHDAETVGPLLDHELFHTYLAPAFPGCMPLWCRLWDEGLATFAAQQLNPGASDRALLLEYPRPIRREVEPRFAEAACLTLAKLDSTDDADARGMFDGGEGLAGWPPRFGYFVGLRVAAKAAERTPLRKLAKLGPMEVRALVEVTLRDLGACPA